MSARFVVRSSGDRLPAGEFLIDVPVTDLGDAGVEIGLPTIAWRAESWHVWGPREIAEDT